MTSYLPWMITSIWRGWPASFNFAMTIFLVEWLMIFFAQSSGKQFKTDFIIWLTPCSPIWDLTYQTLVVGLGIVAKYRCTEFFMVLGQCFNHSSKSLQGSLSLHLLRRTSVLILQCALPDFGWSFFELNPFVSICHLQNGEVFHIKLCVAGQIKP